MNLELFTLNESSRLMSCDCFANTSSPADFSSHRLHHHEHPAQ